MFEELLPPNLALAWGDPRQASTPLYPGEASLVENAVEKRKREFAKGRECARRALTALGVEALPLLYGPRREPLWPEPVVGSITHTDTFCAAAVGLKRWCRGVGIDAEPDEALDDNLVDRIGRRDELAGVEAHLGVGVAARLLFSAKEAFYKCQYPSTGTFLSFADVVTELRDDGTFKTTARAAGLQHLELVQGRWLRRDGLLLTAAWFAD